MIRLAQIVCLAAVTALAACNQRAGPTVTAAVPSTPQPAAASATWGPVLGPDGSCQGQASGTATVIQPGIGECDLVRLKGKAPTDVLIGESGKGQREVQVLYAEPTGKELYFFVNNRLDRIVK